MYSSNCSVYDNINIIYTFFICPSPAHPNKTRSMILHQSKNSFCKNIDLNVKIGKTDIKKTNNYKYLGINLDRNLNWSKHIENYKNKTTKNIGCIM